MSKDQPLKKGKGPRDPADKKTSEDAPSPSDDRRSSRPPQYMTVGTGNTSIHAARFRDMLDSGYGGSSIADEEGISAASMASGPDFPFLSHSDHAPHGTSVEQLWYDHHKAALGRSVDRVIHLLRGLQEMNVTWNTHYPPFDGPEANAPPVSDPRPELQRTQSAALSGPPTMPPPPPMRRSETTFQGNANAESSSMAEQRMESVPRLLNPPQTSRLAVLNLDLKLGHLHQGALVHTLERSSVASLLDGKIRSAVGHLQSLRERIEDLSSKILVTGDVNAGKSTFCNALLRRKILPEDQQPCTAIFCEVLDAMANEGLEEVHAVHLEATYDRQDEQTYDTFDLGHLEEIVSDNTKYKQCKVYVKDTRAANQSLLNNGTVQITLIDAPGLNSHTTKTTAVFARQEEIDVVIFVVSASNHFTISAQDFITTAAAEKAYLFMVVNGFDAIKDKERCEKMIHTQIRLLSPRTAKESSDLVHFVSSNAIPMEVRPPGSNPSGDGGGGGGGDDPDDPKGKGKDVDSIRDFEKLEESLRNFILEKRARSKLAPAKHYLLNILNDINILASVNSEVAQIELDKSLQSLDELEPQLKSTKEIETVVDTEIENMIEKTYHDVYNYTRATLTKAITHAGDNSNSLGALYQGIWSTFSYSEDLKQAMLTQIAASVTHCEDHARSKTVEGVNVIKQLGLLHIGNEFENLNFRPTVMFRRKKDELARQIDVHTELMDFVDWPISFDGDAVLNADTALKVVTAVGGGWIGLHTWMDQALIAAKLMGNFSLRRAIVPGVLVTGLIAITCVIWKIPTTLPRRLSAKIASQLAEIDYVHGNATRISSSVRKVLRIPANNIRVSLDRTVKDLGERRDESLRLEAESNIALKYFCNLVQDSAKQKASVEELDLEATVQG